MDQPRFPEAGERPSLRNDLGRDDRRRIKRLVNRRQPAQREDDAYLAVAYARHTVRWMAWSPAWFIPLMLILGFVVNLSFNQDFVAAIGETFDNSLITALILGLGIPLVQIVKLQRAEQENVDALWKMTIPPSATSGDPQRGAGRPRTSRR
jgi:hypothetical protein